MVETLYSGRQVRHNIIVMHDSLIRSIRVHTKYIVCEGLVACSRGSVRIEYYLIIRINLLLNI